MKFDCPDIGHAATTALSVVERSPIMVTQYFDISASDGVLSVTGSNLEAWVTASVEASVPDAGRCLVSAADFARIAKKRIKADLDGETLRVECGGRFALPTLDESFPRTPEQKDMQEVDGGVDAFCDLVGFCDMSHYNVVAHGVAFFGDAAFAGNGVVMAFSDCGGGAGKIIPASARKIIKRGGRLFLGDGVWLYEAEGIKAVGRLLDADPVDFRQHLGSCADIAAFDADDMRNAIDAAALGRAERCVITFSGGEASVCGVGFNGGHVDTSVTLRCDGIDAAVVVRPKQIVPVLQAMSGRVVSMSHDGRVLRFTAPECGHVAYVAQMRDPLNNMPKIEIAA